MEEVDVRLSDKEAEVGEVGRIVDKEGKFNLESWLSDFWKKNKLTAIIGALGLLLLVIGILATLILASKGSSQIEIISEEEQLSEKKIFVDVAGAVEKPGIYQLTSQARVNDALIAAGGLSASADRVWVAKNLNLAARVKDGTKIYIGFSEESKNSIFGSGQVSGASVEGKININSASISELDRLSGIGPALAQRIIDYRNQNGSYSTKEDLLQVSGIGEKLLEKIKDQIILW